MNEMIFINPPAPPIQIISAIEEESLQTDE
jgi:hypothetical protein